MESQASYSRVDKSTHMNWVLSALLGLFFFGGGNYLLKDFQGSVALKKLLGSLGYLIFLILMTLFHIISLALQKKSNSLCYPGSIYQKHHGFTPGFAIGISGGFIMFAAQVFLLTSWDIDPSAAGIVLLMLVANAPITSILAYFIYKEKFTWIQILGMFLALSGVAALGLIPLLLTTQSSTETQHGHWTSYLFAFLTIIAYSIKNINSRSMQVNGLDIYTAGMLNSLGEVLLGLLLFIYYLIFENSLDLDLPLLYAIIGATLIAFSQYFINQAIMTGNIGVVITLINLNGILFILLDLLFHQVFPDLLTFFLSLFVMFGVIVMLFGDQVLSKSKSS